MLCRKSKGLGSVFSSLRDSRCAARLGSMTSGGSNTSGLIVGTKSGGAPNIYWFRTRRRTQVVPQWVLSW